METTGKEKLINETDDYIPMIDYAYPRAYGVVLNVRTGNHLTHTVMREEDYPKLASYWNQRLKIPQEFPRNSPGIPQAFLVQTQ